MGIGREVAQRLGRYTLVRSLGAGGMAELFLARSDGLEGFAKLVAVKRILPHKASNERFIRMLLNEARLVATLDHPNIAQVYDIGLEAGEYFFAMEYVHGQDLSRILRRAGRPLSLGSAIHIALGVCAGLHHAHEARDASGGSLEIVHRDVNPSNVLVSYQGAVKLIDFGVAKASSQISETQEGAIKGKHGYMSPEQCLGEKLDRRCDVFAIGITLWELTVGRRLYKADGDLASLQRIVYEDATPPSAFVPDYPPELEKIVMRALERHPLERYQSAEELQLDLQAFAVENKIPVSPVAVAQEMAALFRNRLDAWREAEEAGRSLADHLAEVSSEDALGSSAGSNADASASPIAPPAAGRSPEPGPMVSSIRPSHAARSRAPVAPVQRAAPPPAHRAASEMPVPYTAPRAVRSLAVATVLVGGMLGAWALWFRSPETVDPVAADHAGAALAGSDDGVTDLSAAHASGSTPAPAGGSAESGAATAASPGAAVPASAAAGSAPASAPVGSVASAGGSAPAAGSDARTNAGAADSAVAASSRARVAGSSTPGDAGDATGDEVAATAEVDARVEPRASSAPDAATSNRTRSRAKTVKRGGAKQPKGATVVASAEPRREPVELPAPAPAPAPPVPAPAPSVPAPPAAVLTPAPSAGSATRAPPHVVAALPPAHVVAPPPAGTAPGTVDPGKVRSVVRAHVGEIQTCVSRAQMDDRDLSGRVVIRISLAATGRVTGASVASSTVTRPALESCMAKAVASWTFPPPAGNVVAVISYPFAF